MIPRPPPGSIPLLLLACLAGLAGCDGPGESPAKDPAPAPGSKPRRAPPPQFVDVTREAGIDFVNVSGGAEKDYVIEVNGGGVALLDHDLDGDLDIFLVNGSKLDPPHGEGTTGTPPSDALYENLGDLRFREVTREAGLTESAWGCGVTVGDYDNDGDPDIFVANYGRDTLWQNTGKGTFVDVTEKAGTTDPHWGSSCAFVDYDRDGHLDLFIVNYLDFDPAKIRRRGTDPNCQYKGLPILCGPIGLPPAPCTLYRNRGDGTFEDVSESSGIRDVNLEEATYGLGVCVLDADQDGWLDLYVANDTRPNLLFRNRGDGTFEELGLRMGLALNDEALAQAGMGVDARFPLDVAREDLFVVNYEDDSNTYYRNDGQGFFTEMTGPLGLSGPCFKFLGWGAFFFDAELDGDQDLFIAQGHVVPQANEIRSSPGYRQPNKLFLQEEDGRFSDASREAGPGFEVILSSRGAAHGDLDGDGDSDLVIHNIDAPATLLVNHGPPRHAWLAVRVRGTKSNRDGLGAVVALHAGGRVQRRRIRAGSSYASHSETVARFGLGSTRQVERLEVTWPTGRTETYAVPGVDRVLEVVEGQGE